MVSRFTRKQIFWFLKHGLNRCNISLIIENLGEGYNITAYLNLDGKMVPFVQMVYYPIEAGKPGYVHYTGRLNGESLQPVDQWSMLSSDADIAFRGVMEFYGIKLQSAILAAPAAAAPVR